MDLGYLGSIHSELVEFEWVICEFCANSFTLQVNNLSNKCLKSVCAIHANKCSMQGVKPMPFECETCQKWLRNVKDFHAYRCSLWV